MAKHHKQIAYVAPNTLIVGIDIGKSVHFVKMMLEGRQIAVVSAHTRKLGWSSSNTLKVGIIRIVGILQPPTTCRWPSLRKAASNTGLKPNL